MIKILYHKHDKTMKRVIMEDRDYKRLRDMMVDTQLIPRGIKKGIIVAHVGERFSQMLIKDRKEKGVLIEEYHTPCVFVPLAVKSKTKSSSCLCKKEGKD